MTVISLITDFGVEDEYAGVMKGVILSIDPTAVIVDITHGIGPQQVLQAALLIRSAYRFFPENSIHVIVVDPGVGSERAILACRQDNHVFIAPDNGVLTLLLNKDGEAQAIAIENTDYFLSPVSGTFHGRDIFAPVAAWLSRGTPIEKLGPSMDADRIVRLNIPRPCAAAPGELTGTIVAIDHFGNLITNIDLDALKRYGVSPEKAVVALGDRSIEGIRRHYAGVQTGLPLVLTGSRGFLEIAVNGGSARAVFNAAIGDAVRILGRK